MSADPNLQTQRKLDNYNLALAALRRFLAEPQRTEAAAAGIIQAFEFTFEQCWKLFQHLASRQGLTAAFPKAALQAALKLGLIEDERVWLDMLEDRNLSSHTYREALAKALLARVEGCYAQELVAVAERVHDHIAAG